jgi:hypothetical protein
MTKKDKPTKDKFYDKEIAKARLSLMKTAYDVKYNSPADKPQKEIALRLLKEQRTKLKQEESIKKEEKKIYNRSIKGRIEKSLKNIHKQRGFVPKSLQKSINKLKLNPNKVISQIASQQGALVRPGRTGYFSDEYAEEVKWLG